MECTTPPEALAFDVSQLQLKHFRIIKRLGRRTITHGYYGVTSAVYLASPHDKPLYLYALKICFNLDAANIHSEQLLERFESEYQTPSRSRLPPHENIVRILSVFTDRVVAASMPDWSFDAVSAHSVVVVMEAQPRTLAQVLEMCLERTWVQAITEARLARPAPPFFSNVDLLSVIAGVLAGVAHIHAHRIVHRDLKPENILVSLDLRVVRITDFGCCLDCVQNELDGFCMPLYLRNVSRGGAPAYMAPEVVGPDPGRGVVIDYSKSDEFAAGLILYNMCSAEWPFLSMNSREYARETFRPLPQVYSWVRDLVEGLLETNPALRIDARAAAAWAQTRRRAATRTARSAALAQSAAETARRAARAPAATETARGAARPPAATGTARSAARAQAAAETARGAARAPAATETARGAARPPAAMGTARGAARPPRQEDAMAAWRAAAQARRNAAAAEQQGEAARLAEVERQRQFNLEIIRESTEEKEEQEGGAWEVETSRKTRWHRFSVRDTVGMERRQNYRVYRRTLQHRRNGEVVPGAAWRAAEVRTRTIASWSFHE